MKLHNEDYRRIMTALTYYKQKIVLDGSVMKSQKKELTNKIDETMRAIETIGTY